LSLPGSTLPDAAFIDAVALLGVVVVPVFLDELSTTRVPLDVLVEDDIFIEGVAAADDIFMEDVAVAIVIEGFITVEDMVIEGFMVDTMDICAKPLLASRRAGAMITLNSMMLPVLVVR